MSAPPYEHGPTCPSRRGFPIRTVYPKRPSGWVDTDRTDEHTVTRSKHLRCADCYVGLSW